MTQIVETNDGLKFHCVTDGNAKWFLLECPDCGEKLPLTEAMLQGTEMLVHESPNLKDHYCSFKEHKTLGQSLVAAMQANILFNATPFSIVE